jgi:hypothetical protein
LDHDPNCKAGGDALDQALKIAEGFADPLSSPRSSADAEM